GGDPAAGTGPGPPPGPPPATVPPGRRRTGPAPHRPAPPPRGRPSVRTLRWGRPSPRAGGVARSPWPLEERVALGERKGARRLAPQQHPVRPAVVGFRADLHGAQR